MIMVSKFLYSAAWSSAFLLTISASSAAQACERWTLSGPFTIAQANGYTVNGQFQQQGNTLGGKASYFAKTLGDNGTQLNGELRGTVTGNAVRFEISWFGSVEECGAECYASSYDALGVYEGTIDRNGKLSGVTFSPDQPAARSNWNVRETIACTAAAPSAVGSIARQQRSIGSLSPPADPRAQVPNRNLGDTAARIRPPDPRAITKAPSIIEPSRVPPAPRAERIENVDRPPARITDYVPSKPIVRQVPKLPPKRIAAAPRVEDVRGGRPIPFVPFPMKDAQTGRAISADETIIFPDGRQANAGVYFAWLNKFEERLNELGYSSRDTPPTKGEEMENAFLVGRYVPDKALIERQRQRLAAAGALKSGLTSPGASTGIAPPPGLAGLGGSGAHVVPPPVDPAVAQTQDILISNARRMAERTKRELATRGYGVTPFMIKCRPLADPKFSPSAGWEFGDPEYVQGYAGAKAWISGTICDGGDPKNPYASQSKVGVGASTAIGGWLFNNELSLLELKSRMDGDQKKGEVSANFEMWIAGQKIVDFPIKQTAEFRDKDTILDIGLGDPSFTGLVSILNLINVTYTVQVRGNAGLDYELVLLPTNLHANLSPYVNAEACGRAGAGVGTQVIGVSVGVGGCLQMVRARVTFGAGGGLGFEGNKPVAVADMYANANLKLLGGEVFVFAQYYAPCVSFPPWCEHIAKFNILEWDPLQIDEEIVRESVALPLR